MENLHGILVFLNVVDAGTLSGAARKLGVSTAAVSATIARLEKKLAVRLLDRTTRRLVIPPFLASARSGVRQRASISAWA